MARTRRRALLLLFTLIALGAAVFGALPVNADSPSPSIQPTPAATVAPTGVTPTPASSPTASPGTSPCPLPAVTPRPSDAPTPVPGATPLPHALCPAQPTDPVGVLAFLFNPIFQTMFLLLAVFYSIFGDIGIAIIILTLIIKTLLIPLFRQQIVSQRRMQMVQPEIKAISVKYKGNRTKINEEQMRLYRERGVNPASGCLPSFLQLFLLLPIYSVINSGLGAPNIDSALQFLGQPVLHIVCQAPGTLQPCIDPTIHWLGNLDAHMSEVIFRLPAGLPLIAGFGISLLAIASALLQLIQSRMVAQRSSDPQVQSQQRIMLFLPLISIVYGSFLPAGLFIYWIVFTAYSIVQQYLIVGWGSLFPLFGWTPAFARDHQPRFPVTPAPPKRDQSGDGRSTTTDSRSPEDRAAGTIRPDRQRARTSRRGRRR